MARQLHLQEREARFQRIEGGMNELYRSIDEKSIQRFLDFPAGYDMTSMQELASRLLRAESPEAVLSAEGITPKKFDEVVIHLKDSDRTLTYPFRYISVGYADRQYTRFNDIIQFGIRYRNMSNPADAFFERKNGHKEKTR